MSIYNIKGLKASSESFGAVKEGIWAQLLICHAHTLKFRKIVEDGMQLSVGNGNSILFWHDRLCDLGPLKTSFPRLFAISLQDNAFISQMGLWHNGVLLWNLNWKTRLYDWEMEDLERLKILIEQITPRMDKTDDVIWKWSIVCSFPNKEIVEKFYESSVPILPKLISSSLWKIRVPPRAQLVFSLANLEKLKKG